MTSGGLTLGFTKVNAKRRVSEVEKNTQEFDIMPVYLLVIMLFKCALTTQCVVAVLVAVYIVADLNTANS